MRRKRDSFKIISFMSTEPLLYSIPAPYVLRKNQKYSVYHRAVHCSSPDCAVFWGNNSAL